jgi:hypothetical protein
MDDGSQAQQREREREQTQVQEGAKGKQTCLTSLVDIHPRSISDLRQSGDWTHSGCRYTFLIIDCGIPLSVSLCLRDASQHESTSTAATTTTTTTQSIDRSID